MNYFKYIIFLLYFLLSKNFFSQTCLSVPFPNCGCINSEFAGNYCCGHDPEFTGQTSNHQLLFPANGSANFCNSGNYDFVNINSAGSIGGDWFLVWDDQFNYGQLNKSFYLSGLPYGANDQNSHFIFAEDEISVADGKLKLTASYHPNKPYSYYGFYPNSTTYNFGGTANFDWSAGCITSKFYFPINSRFQTSNKLYPNPTKTWPALWLMGPHDGNKYQEIDIYEVTAGGLGAAGSSNPQSSLKMTYHSTKYGYIDSRQQEGIHHETNTDMTAGFNQYDLIWDKWKLQWWFNSLPVHEINQYYYVPNVWNETQRDENYRLYPMDNYNTMASHVGDGFAVNKYYPSSYASQLIFGFGLQSSISPSDVGAGKTQEMDFLKIWLRGSCSANRTITAVNYVQVQPNNEHGTVIETGYNIITNPGSQVTLKGSFPKANAIYAAINQIAFNDGFSVEEGADFFAFLSTCETAWDYRMSNNNVDPVNNPSDDVIGKQNEATINSDNRKNILLNYTNDDLEFSCTGSDIYTIKIYDMKVQLVYNDAPHVQTLSLSKSQFVPGIYTSVITSAAGTDVRKIWVIK